MASVVSSIAPEDLDKISRFVTEHIGFSYAPERLSDLNRGFHAACHDLGLDSSTCLQLLDDPKSCSALEEELVKKLTVGETYFFRDKNLFLNLRDKILPDLIRIRRTGRKYIRIWSAACSTGEEPYSVAMLLCHLLPDIYEWEISILGTDINPGSLHAAARGIYSKWSFREQAPVSTESYLSLSPDGRFQVSPEIRKMVRFNKLNLISDSYPSTLTSTTTMDIVFCRNVLMYFSPETAGFVVDRLNKSLVDGGWLIVSPQEISYAQRPGFVQVKQSSVFLFKKGDEKLVDDHKIQPSDKHPLILNPKTSFFHTGSSFEDGFKPLSIHHHVKLDKNRKKSEKKDPSLIVKGLKTIQSSVPVLTPAFFQAAPISSEHNNSESPEFLIKTGRIFEAEILLTHEEKPTIKSLFNMEMLARAFADMGESDHALGWCDRILAIDPLSPGAYHLRAVIYQERGEIDSCVQSLRQSLYADPDYIPAHLMLAMVMKGKGKPVDARRHYQIALSILMKMDDDAPVDLTDGIPAARVREMISFLLEEVKGA